MKIFKKHKLNQNGFSHHFILPVLVIAVVASIGVYLLNKSKAAELPASATPNVGVTSIHTHVTISGSANAKLNDPAVTVVRDNVHYGDTPINVVQLVKGQHANFSPNRGATETDYTYFQTCFTVRGIGATGNIVSMTVVSGSNKVTTSMETNPNFYTRFCVPTKNSTTNSTGWDIANSGGSKLNVYQVSYESHYTGTPPL